MRIALTGDVMLGRLVDKYVLKEVPFRAEYVWGNTLSILKSADVRLINLECVISKSGIAIPKVFNFRADPKAIDVLKAADINAVALANNHVLDFGEKALTECLTLLKENNITHAGAGENLSAAAEPHYINVNDSTIALISLTDNEPSWEARENKPGINYIKYSSNGLSEPYLSRITEILKRAKEKANFVIVAAHVGPNWGPPSKPVQALAHQLIDLGADLYWGHSNHTTQGIEIYKKKPIFYSTGDFIDDYAVDPLERNDLSFLFLISVEKSEIKGVELHPVKINNFQVNRAEGSELIWIDNWMRDHCKNFGIVLEENEGVLSIDFTR